MATCKAVVHTVQRQVGTGNPLVSLSEVECDGEPFRNEGHCHISKEEIGEFLPIENPYGYQVLTLNFNADIVTYKKYDKELKQMVNNITFNNITNIEPSYRWIKKPLQPKDPIKKKKKLKKFKTNKEVKSIFKVYDTISTKISK